MPVGAVLLGVAVVAGVAVPARAGAPAEPAGCAGCSHHGRGAVEPDGYLLTMTALGKVAAATGVSLGGDAAAGYRYAFAPACAANTDPSGDAVCPGVTHCPHKGDIRFWVWRGSDGQPLVRIGTVCLGSGDTVSSAQVGHDLDVSAAAYLHLAAPALRSAPGDRPLVHLPTVYWATGPDGSATGGGQRSATVLVDDVSVTVTARPTWLWSFGDGASVLTSGGGVPFDAAHDPRVDPGYYAGGVVHAYRAPGAYPAHVRVVWTPSYTATFQGGTYDLTPLTFEAAELVAVREARAVLVAG